jgi:DNA integrity scanning protein DisA with diadenylate cyclase activity
VKDKMISEALIKHARELAQDISADALLIYADAAHESEELRQAIAPLTLRTILLTRDEDFVPSNWNTDLTWITVPNVHMTRTGQVKLGLLICFARGILTPGARVIFLTGIQKSKSIDTLMVLHLDTESELLSIHSTMSINGDFRTEVFERTLALAAALASQGREGHPIGTIFVLGDSEKVLAQTKSLVLNPFYGYPEEKRNILDVRLGETIKEFSSIDGAFIIRGDGVIMSAGAHLVSTLPLPKLPKGLGTRHASAAGITNSTSAIAFCVSQSTGNLTVFKSGRLIAEITKPAPLAPLSLISDEEEV